MKKLILLLLINILVATPALARDSVRAYSIEEAFAVQKLRHKLGNNISFFFGDQKHASVTTEIGEWRSNKKTNAFNKSDKKACQRVLYSALISLRDRAMLEGGNAVINIKSNYKNVVTSSETTYQCGAGALMAGVALIGTVVTIEE